MTNPRGAAEPLYTIRQLPAFISLVTDLSVQVIRTGTEILAGIFLPLADLFFGSVFWTLAVFPNSTDLLLGLDKQAWMISIITSGIQITLWNAMGGTLGKLRAGLQIRREEWHQFLGLLAFSIPVALADTLLDLAWVGVNMYPGFSAREVLVPDGDLGYRLAIIIMAFLMTASEPLTYFMVTRRSREHGGLTRFSDWLGNLWGGVTGHRGQQPRQAPARADQGRQEQRPARPVSSHGRQPWDRPQADEDEDPWGAD